MFWLQVCCIYHFLLLLRLVIGHGWKSFIKDSLTRSGRGRRKAKNTGIRKLFFPSFYITGTWLLVYFLSLGRWNSILKLKFKLVKVSCVTIDISVSSIPF